MRQLPLDLVLPPRYEREAFLSAPSNAAALHAVEGWPDWPDRIFMLIGPPGAGKSHLAAIWAERAQATALRPADLLRAELPALVGRAAVLDDAEAAARQEEAALFHCLNLVREQEAFLLLTARTPPERWGIATPDLLSRLRLAPTATLGAPDEALLRSVLQKLFADRQIAVDETVVAYLALHLDRSLADARRVVEALDRTGLALGRRVTRAMAAAVLDEILPARDD
jgi:chromosomal replication initiation ATPase DnaA